AGYRPRRPRGDGKRHRALPIAREGLRRILARRALLGFAGLAGLPFVLVAAALLLFSRLPQLSHSMPSTDVVLRNYVRYAQILIGVLFAAWAGSGMVADDVRSGALLVYLARPLTRADYVLGKLSVLVGTLFLLMVGPPLLLWMLAVALGPHDLAARGLLWAPLSIVLAAAMI